MRFFRPLFVVIRILTVLLSIRYSLSDFLSIGNYDINIVIFGLFKLPLPIVILAPFILSDIPLCNVLFLKGGSPAVEMMQENTFGANIHGMLKNGFFLPSLPIGEFAHEKINVLFERLNGYKLDARSEEQAEWFYSNIMRVGEPYLREQLMRLYNMHYPVRDYD